MFGFSFFKTETKKDLTAEDLFKEDKQQDITESLCDWCVEKNECKLKNMSYLCKFMEPLPDYDANKPSILILDDNMGVVSFIKDDLVELYEDGVFDINKYNILTFSSQNASFILSAALKRYDGLNIVFGIFDLTIGGGVYDEKHGNIILDGVDSMIECKELNPDMEYLFFTGNKMNEYITKNKLILKKYKDFTGKDMREKILFKTTLTPTDRKEYLGNLLKKLDEK